MLLCEVQHCKFKKYIDKIFKGKVEKCLKSEPFPHPRKSLVIK